MSQTITSQDKFYHQITLPHNIFIISLIFINIVECQSIITHQGHISRLTITHSLTHSVSNSTTPITSRASCDAIIKSIFCKMGSRIPSQPNRVILILMKVGILTSTWFQNVPFCSLISEQFLFSFQDHSFRCP